MKRLLLLGGGGHCHSVLDSVLSLEEYDEIGIIDFKEDNYNGIIVVGKDEDLPSLFKEGWNMAFITVGSVGNTSARRRLYRNLKEIGYTLPTIVDPTATIARDVIIGEGTFVGKNAVINAGSEIGTCAIINTEAVVEHDNIIGDFSHISPGAILCGNVIVGSDTHIGAGAVIIQQLQVGNQTIIGAGSVVVRNIGSGLTAFGNPCKGVEQ